MRDEWKTSWHSSLIPHPSSLIKKGDSAMRWASLIVVGLMGLGLAADDKPLTYTFGKDDTGKLPRGWTAARTGKGEGSVWKVVADESAPSKKGHVLAQTAEGPNAFFNLCVLDDSKYTDLEATVSFKPVRGEKDQGGGLVWRYQDANNYYVARFNPLEDN